jgi:endonuclease/exonuclease/phosphatase family metal-dependent hydrolase
MVHDWVYGRRGDPIAVQLIGTSPNTGVYASDHYGILAEIDDQNRP